MFGKSVLVAVAAGAVLSSFAIEAPARADAAVKLGVLTCHVDSGFGFVFGSSRGLRCTYTGSGRAEHYAGDGER